MLHVASSLKLVITRKNLFPFAPVVRLVIFLFTTPFMRKVDDRGNGKTAKNREQKKKIIKEIVVTNVIAS